LFLDYSCDVEVKEENLLDVSIYREAFIENRFDDELNVNPSELILFLARKRIGEKGYDLILDNCQHFCNSVRYGAAVSQEIEESTFEGIMHAEKK